MIVIYIVQWEVSISFSHLLPPFTNQVVKILKITVTWFIAKFTICQSLRFICFTSLDVLLTMSMID